MKITRKRAQRRAERAVLKGEPKQKEGKAAVRDRRTSRDVWVMRGPRWDSERGSRAETRSGASIKSGFGGSRLRVQKRVRLQHPQNSSFGSLIYCHTTNRRVFSWLKTAALFYFLAEAGLGRGGWSLPHEVLAGLAHVSAGSRRSAGASPTALLASRVCLLEQRG